MILEPRFISIQPVGIIIGLADRETLKLLWLNVIRIIGTMAGSRIIIFPAGLRIIQ